MKNQLSIESGDNGFILKFGDQTEITEKELLNVLATLPNSDEFSEKLQEMQLAKKKEQYEKLQPEGFEHAPESAIQYRESLKDSDNVEQMEYLQKNVSYNSDKTVNILSLNKTFCEDISGKNRDFNYADAQKLAEDTGYSLMTDYNDTDSEGDKQGSDWYKVINIFSGNNGDTKEGMDVFGDMTGCKARYWTATPYKNENGKVLEGVVRVRKLNEDNLTRHGRYTYNNTRVCGFKDSM